MPSSAVCEPFPAPPATPALSAALLDSTVAAAGAAEVGASTTPAAPPLMGADGETTPMPPHVDPPAPPKSIRAGSSGSSGGSGSGRERRSSGSPSRSPQRQLLPPLPPKALGRSISNPVFSSSSKPQRPGSAGLGGRGPLRKGKWTPEEEVYAHYIIDNFNKGLISLSRGTTLRSYLSDKLHCDPMRVTKKFSGTSCIGKSVFCPAEPTAQNLELIKVVGRRLAELEHNFKSKIESHPPYGAATAAAHAAQTQTHQQQQQLVASQATAAPHGLPGALTPHPRWSKARHPPPPPLGLPTTTTATAGVPPPPLPTTSSPAAGAGPSPPRAPAFLSSRHSMPDLRLAAAMGDPGTQRLAYGGKPSALLGRGQQPHHKRSRSYDVEVLSLDDHDAGDLLVNFFASVHRTYSVDSNLHEMGDSNGTDDMDTDADHDPPAVTPQPTTPCTITMPGNGNGEAFPSLASSPSEATLLPEPSPTGSAMSSGNEEGCTNAVGGGQTCKEEEEAAAEASVAEEPSVKRQKVAIDGC